MYLSGVNPRPRPLNSSGWAAGRFTPSLEKKKIRSCTENLPEYNEQYTLGLCSMKFM